MSWITVDIHDSHAVDLLPRDPDQTHSDEYAETEYAKLPVNVAVLPSGPTVVAYRARPRNAIIARSTSTTCSAVSRPTRTWTFDLLTVVSLSIITSLS